MSTSTSSNAIEQLPSNIPHLETDSSNWAIFIMRFREAMQATCRWPYFEGTVSCPTMKDPSKVTEAKKKATEEWEHGDLAACYLLSQRLPDSIAARLQSLTTAKSRWERLTLEFTMQSMYAQNDLEQAFFEMRCPKGGDIRTFLTALRCKKEDLAAAGVHITQKEYQRTVLKSLPDELAKFAALLLSNAQISNQVIGTETLINNICEESEQLKNCRTRNQQGQGGNQKDGQADEALAATESEGGKRKCHQGNCHNCGKPGHWARECHKPKKKAEDTTTSNAPQGNTNPPAKSENKPIGSANAVAEHDFEGDGFWMAVEEDAPLHALTIGADPDPCIGDPDDDEGEAQNELIFTWDGPDDWLTEVSSKIEGEELAGAVITASEGDDSPHIELFDSGATRHISPYKGDFTSYSPLMPPVFLTTANQQRFPAVGMGMLAIQVPSRRGETELLLNNALHAPAVGYTLVSLGTLDEEGYHARIGGRYLEIDSPHGDRIGCVARTAKRLYRVSRIEDAANTVDMLTIMELHHRLSHIAASSARKLVKSGAVTGIKLNPSSKEAACDVCIFVHATRHPVPKIRISSPAQNFGDEVHTDVWGPSSTPTRQGRKYFITFTNDATRYTVTFLMRTKDEALEAYKSYEAWALAQQHCKAIKVLRSDQGGEYLSKAFDQHLAAVRTARKLTTHDTPQLNSVAERLNRTLLERIRAFTHTSGLPKMLWGEGLRHATWLKNWMATHALDGKTPF